jgi:hypothetical protein
MKSTRILVCSDAGAAGRDLLARRDVELDWALTPEESVAALQSLSPDAVVAREDFVLTLLRHGRRAIDGTPVVVLVEPDGWERRDRYFEAGATALVRASNRDRILEALSELTGLNSSVHPRVPYDDVVDIRLRGRRRFHEGVELSSSGVTVRDVEEVALGTTCEVTLVMMDPPYTFSAMVIRQQHEGAGRVTGLAFNAISDDERAMLLEQIAKKQRALEPLPEPVGLTADLSGSTFTLDLFTAMQGESSNERYHELLAELVEAGDDILQVRAPRWLRRVCRHLTELERRALSGGPAPEYALAALDMRIDLARSRAFNMRAVPSQKEVDLCLDFCRALAVDSVDSEVEDLAQVPRIRAELLREVYGTVFTPVDEVPPHLREHLEPEPDAPRASEAPPN